MPLIGQTVGEDVVFFSAAILLLTVLVGAFRAARSCRCLLKVKCALTSAVKAISMWTKAEPSKVDLIVHEKLREQKLDQFHMLCQIFCSIAFPFTVNLMLNIWKGESRGHTFAQDVLQLVEHSVAALITVFPGTLSSRTIDIFYTIVVLGLAAYTAPFIARPELLFQSLIIVNFVVFTLTMVRRTSTPVVPLLNSVVITVACSSIWMHGGNVFMQPKLMLVGQALVGIVSTIVAHILEKGSQAAMRQCLEMQTTKELLSAACALLGSCCDVVVELDPEGVIVCPAIDLGSFLLRGPGRKMQGWKLVDLMSNAEDRQAFSDRLGAPRVEGMGLAEAMHVSMKDGTGNTLHLELLWFQFSCLSGEPRYMLGMREFCDLSKSRQHRQQGIIEPDGIDKAAFPDHEEGFSLPEESFVITNSLAEPQAVAVLDCLKEGLLIKSVSSGFCMRIGRLPHGTCLAHSVRKGDSFAAWLQQSLNAISVHEEAEDYGVRLRMPQGEMQATCRVLLDKSSSGSGDSREGWVQEQGAAIDITRVRLLFSGIRLCHSHSMYGNQGPSQLKGTPVSLMNL
mmetsp:Transcript_118890/g.348199  ORF Transcript_118890/g.348199 Transcript_118890/m.348199 type:complete len:566 (+) Transcript_118890:62-1759(+)